MKIMQINLKQNEIEAAIKQFLQKQGLNLGDKTVAMTFVAGRKENGLTVEINVEDSPIPGFTDADEEVVPSGPIKRNIMSVVPNNPQEYVAEPEATEVKVETVEQSATKETSTEVEVTTTEEVSVVPAKKPISSLFGN